MTVNEIKFNKLRNRTHRKFLNREISANTMRRRDERLKKYFVGHLKINFYACQ